MYFFIIYNLISGIQLLSLDKVKLLKDCRTQKKDRVVCRQDVCDSQYHMISQNCHQWLSVESNNHRYIFGTKLGKLSHPAALYFQFRMTVLTSVLPDKIILICMVATYMYMYGNRSIDVVIFCDNSPLLETLKAFENLKSWHEHSQ